VLELLEQASHVVVNVPVLRHGFLDELPHDLWPAFLQHTHLLIAEQGRLEEVRGEDSGSNYSVLLRHAQGLRGGGVVVQPQAIYRLHTGGNTGGTYRQRHKRSQRQWNEYDDTSKTTTHLLLEGS